MWKHRWKRVVQSNGKYLEGCDSPDDEEQYQREDMNKCFDDWIIRRHKGIAENGVYLEGLWRLEVSCVSNISTISIC